MAHYQQSAPLWSRSSVRTKFLFLAITVVVAFTLLLYIPPPSSCYTNRDTVVCQVAHKAKSHFQSKPQKEQKYKELSHIKSKYAFATFLSGKEDAKITDHYFVAVRTLTYQLLYANETRSRDPAIPFVVLCTDKVPLELRERLQRDGAHVVIGESITSDWAKTSVANWQDILTKLRLWELTQFERVALLDGDTILTQPLDGIFTDPAVALQETQVNKTHPDDPVIKPDEHPLPPNYAFAAVTEMKFEHAFPPSRENNDYPNYNYFNAGFFVFKPSLDMLAYYLSVLSIPDRFSPEMQEQNLLNYAHRREGAMSWVLLENTWNIHFPRWEDVEGGVKSIHDKWWNPLDDRLKEMMVSWRWRMEGFFEMRDTIVR